MRGAAIESADTFVTLNVPDEEKLLEGQGENTVARVVVYDNKAKRASGVTAETVLTLKATKKPLNLPIILGAAGIVVVILLLVIVLLRGGGGGGKGKRSNQSPARADRGRWRRSTSLPGRWLRRLGGGGYGASALGSPKPRYAPAALRACADGPAATLGPARARARAGLRAPRPHRCRRRHPSHHLPNREEVAHPLASAGGAPVVQVRCPACNMLTMASPGQASVCFSCGQPLPQGLPPAAAEAAPPAGAFPLTGAMASPLEPPPNPYGATGALDPRGGRTVRDQGGRRRSGRSRSGAVSDHAGRASRERRSCDAEVRERGQLMVRDEGSNNGTYVNGLRIPANVFTPVSSGGQLRFGPVEFSVRLE